MKAIGLIYGRDSYASNGGSHEHLTDALRESGAEVYDAFSGQQRTNRDDIDDVLEMVSKAGGPTMLFGILNGRSLLSPNPKLRLRSTPASQPQCINGHNKLGLRPLMDRIVTSNRYNPHPVDIFLLTASRPDFIHKYARDLPRGSTLIAVQTPPSSRTNSTFWDMVNGPEMHGLITPRAHHLLSYYLASNGPIVRQPQIAVTGHSQRQLHDIWQQFIYTETISADAASLFDKAAPHLPPATKQRVIDAKADIENNKDFTEPKTGAHFAWAIESAWDKVYPPRAPAIEPVQIMQPQASQARKHTESPPSAAYNLALPEPRPQLSTGQALRNLAGNGVPLNKLPVYLRILRKAL